MAGDGTVMWVVQEAELHHINPQRMHIGMVPLGTGSMWDGWADYLAFEQLQSLLLWPGNDFSRSLGWGGRSLGKDGSATGRHDLWSTCAISAAVLAVQGILMPARCSKTTVRC